VEEARVEVRVDNISDASSGAAADLIISEGGVAVKYNVYLRDQHDITLEFASTDRSRVELAARLLKHAGVSAEVKKEGGRDVWYVTATTDRLAAGREELRKALAVIVREAEKKGWVNKNTAERWLEKLEKGLTLSENWPKYNIQLIRGMLMIRYQSPNPNNIQQVAQRLREMGLVEGVHFTVKMPKEGRKGYVLILREGLAYAAWLSVHSKDKQQRELAAEFVNYILKRVEKIGGDVLEKAKEIIDEGRSWGSLKLEDLKDSEMEVEVDGRRYVVKVKGGEAVKEKQNGKTLLRIKIKAEVGYVKDGQIENRVEREYTITYSRRRNNNTAMGSATARADAPGGRKAEAERYSALIKALTGKEPRVNRKSDGKIMIECYGGHLKGFMRYAELVETILKWLVETSRR
jgi:hypothetical protein